MKNLLICLLLIAACLLIGCSTVKEKNAGVKERDVYSQSNEKSETQPIKVENRAAEVASGAYQGQSDNNFFEVKIEGMEDAYKVFMITDKIRPVFEKLDLKKDDKVEIEYFENKFGQLEVQSIRTLP